MLARGDLYPFLLRSRGVGRVLVSGVRAGSTADTICHHFCVFDLIFAENIEHKLCNRAWRETDARTARGRGFVGGIVHTRGGKGARVRPSMID